VAALLDLPARDPALAEALARLDGPDGRLVLAGLNPSAAAVLLPSFLARHPGRKIVLLVPGEREAESFRSDLAFTTALLRGPRVRVAVFPSLEADPYQEMAPHLLAMSDRVTALRALREPGEAIVVVPARALIYALAAPADFDLATFDLRARMNLRPDDLSGALLAAGYQRVDLVGEVGEFSRRGGIMDLFPPDAALPLRVEFYGEEVESLRRFDPGTQRSGEALEAARVPPLREYPWDAAAIERLRAAFVARQAERAAPRATLRASELAEKIEALASGRTFPGFEACVRLVDAHPSILFDYAPQALVAAWEESRVQSELESVYVEMHAGLDFTESFNLPPPEDLLVERGALQTAARRARLRLSELALDEESAPVRVACAPVRSYHARLQDLAKDLDQTAPSTTTVCLMDTLGRIERLAEVLTQYGRPPLVAGAPEAALPAAKPRAAASPAPAPAGAAPRAAAPSRLVVAPGRLSQGFVLSGLGLQVFTEKEVFGEHAERETRRRKVAAFSPNFRDLKVGDLVVHVEHGVGKYGGIMRVGEGASQRDFMLLFYEGQDKLYVPVDRLDLVQRYSGVPGQKGRLDRLGGLGWERTKKRVRRAMEDMAKELLELYAARAAAKGHAFAEDTPWQKEFEDAFPWPLTPDQERAVRDVKADMERDTPMDRLICGDVGFGKTEVAMRAAFKAVMEGKQVAVLCPTTILAFQHQTTFRERFASWPTGIEMVSRFRTAKDATAVLDATAAGKVDILIGTHRLLSKDVRFKNLGLLIVDEEQRFGVKHKESIKAIKKNVDVLTLTATPIPRTLQMSLAGIRDMSVIETPPENRLAIQTAIVPFREGTIATAIRHELQRGGQIYFVHNRVESIGSMANFLHKIVPEARVAIGHGQMSEGMLERTMMSFLSGEADILLATTIIENGLDIPRVNTLIVNRADRFGLAQLYQLRGRVGRSDRRAYAYLMVPGRKALTDVARRRLKALQEFTELGSGFRIAAMDLEIRGAGNMLGGEQSGHIAAVGFDMYCNLLEAAVRELKGEAPAPETKVQINLGVDIRLPEEYIADFGDRLVLYKEIASAADAAALDRIQERARDVYGEPPPQAERLLALARLRIEADAVRVRSIDLNRGGVQITFSSEAPPDPESIVRLVNGRRDVRLQPPALLRLDLPAGAADASRIEAVRELLRALTVAGPRTV
ncbi:MAG TPA: transcription-repair coupling factor, partial [Dongiaceae bacterium]|nr:transcription-repair coupling factor [Dongiaceae bacterium]